MPMGRLPLFPTSTIIVSSKGLKEENIFRKLAIPFSTSGDHINQTLPATTPAAAWIDEGEALTWGDATLHRFSGCPQAPCCYQGNRGTSVRQKIQSGNFIITLSVRLLANAEENAFINGTGSGQPLGILAARAVLMLV